MHLYGSKFIDLVNKDNEIDRFLIGKTMMLQYFDDYLSTKTWTVTSWNDCTGAVLLTNIVQPEVPKSRNAQLS